MPPEPEQKPILSLLHDYTAVRIGLGVPYDPAKLPRDVARSVELQNQLWHHVVTVTAAAPQSLPAYRFVASLNEMNNIHESRLTALRYHIPGEVMFLLIAVAMMATGVYRLLCGRTRISWARCHVYHVADHSRGGPSGGRSRSSGTRSYPGAGAAADRRAAKYSAVTAPSTSKS